jgi:hypothetical protein
VVGIITCQLGLSPILILLRRAESYGIDELPEQLWIRDLRAPRTFPMYALGWRFSREETREQLKSEGGWQFPAGLVHEVFASPWKKKEYMKKLCIFSGNRVKWLTQETS